MRYVKTNRKMWRNETIICFLCFLIWPKCHNMNKLKYELSQLVKEKYYKTVNSLLPGNHNTWLFNTKELNEDIQCVYNYFLKQNGMMKFEFRPRSKDQK